MDVTPCTREWRVEMSQEWDVLGPFPIHAREQHFLSPAFPLDLSKDIDLTRTYPSAYADGGFVSWSKASSDEYGSLKVSHPNIRWEQLRATEGWAALQHHNVLRTYLTVYPPDFKQERTEVDPRLRVECLQGAYFSILPGDETAWATHVSEWHMGNVYALERAPVQFVSLPMSPCRAKATRYQVVLCGPYEIRLFGDPRSYNSEYPILSINFNVSIDTLPSLGTSPYLATPVLHAPAHDVIPDFIYGLPFSSTLGIGLRNVDFCRNTKSISGWWTVVSAVIPPCAGLGLSLCSLLMATRLAPTQTHTLMLEFQPDSGLIPTDITELPVDITISPFYDESACSDDEQQIFRVNVPIRHVPMWTSVSYTAIRATYNLGFSNPTMFLVLPPRYPNNGSEGGLKEPILALHGAGVDILNQSFWADSLPRQDRAWVIIPSGRTSWGLDWHGPSAADAFAAVTALHDILCTRFADWVYPRDTKIIVMGHSNGGQGAWYVASRWPDKVKAVVAAAGYIKSQAYVPWTMSRFSHFIDPALRAVLETSLLPDDNDLFLSNLAHTPVLAIHGGMDDNVPPWHTREAVSVLKEWNPDADVTYHEEPGQPHWWFEVLKNTRVQAFLDRVCCSSYDALTTKCRKFTLTVAVPAESGPMGGWRVHALEVPGRLGRLEVYEDDEGGVNVKASNISVISFDLSKASVNRFVINSQSIAHASLEAGTIWLEQDTTLSSTGWKVVDSYVENFQQPLGRAEAILSADGIIDIVIPSLHRSFELSVALRIAHNLRTYHLLDARILSAHEAENGLACGGNMVVIGCADSLLVKDLLRRSQSEWSHEGGAWVLNDKKFDNPTSGLLFLVKRTSIITNTALFLQSSDPGGLERALRLFPIRTGVLVPDWLVVDGRADRIGAGGAEGAGVWGSAGRSNNGKWGFNDRMSWFN